MAIKIGLDAGHGLNTAGKRTPDGIREWSLNDKVRDKIVNILNEYDVEIIHTDNDEGNVDESLSSRLSKYLNAGVKAFVSIHHNAFTGNWGNATGVEVYTDKKPSTQDRKLAECIYNRLTKYTGLKGRGIKRENWYVINQNKIPAVLVEGGFMDGTNDYKVITSEAGQNAYAKAVAEGLIEFLGLQKKTSNVQPTPAPAPTPAAAGCYPRYTGGSGQIDVVLSAIGVPAAYRGNWSKRKPIASANGIANYSGTAAQNTTLITLAKQGQLRIAGSATPAPAPAPSNYYPRYIGSSGQVDVVFAAIGVPAAYRGNWSKRKVIAQINGIGGYTGTAAQNNTLISLAKQGRLKKS